MFKNQRTKIFQNILGILILTNKRQFLRQKHRNRIYLSITSISIQYFSWIYKQHELKNCCERYNFKTQCAGSVHREFWRWCDIKLKSAQGFRIAMNQRVRYFERIFKLSFGRNWSRSINVLATIAVSKDELIVWMKMWD